DNFQAGFFEQNVDERVILGYGHFRFVLIGKFRVMIQGGNINIADPLDGEKFRRIHRCAEG
ncbi:MAG: hypothetical protein RQ722_11140, partial [Desulfuromonadales bacterium]|nr:hypothetical protein [Desulfuromonadales bacterium]